MTDTKPEREKTAYHVLSQKSPEGLFELVGKNLTAANADAAIRAYIERVAASDSTFDGSGTYIAVPSRSWKPVTVTAETKTVLKLS